MLVTVRLKYIVEHEWGKRGYLDMSKQQETDKLKGRRSARRGRGRGRLNQFVKFLIAPLLGRDIQRMHFVVLQEQNDEGQADAADTCDCNLHRFFQSFKK